MAARSSCSTGIASKVRGYRFTHAAGVTHDEVALQAAGILCRNAGGAERPETGVDAIHRVSAGRQPGHALLALRDEAAGAIVQLALTMSVGDGQGDGRGQMILTVSKNSSCFHTLLLAGEICAESTPAWGAATPFNRDYLALEY